MTKIVRNEGQIAMTKKSGCDWTTSLDAMISTLYKARSVPAPPARHMLVW